LNDSDENWRAKHECGVGVVVLMKLKNATYDETENIKIKI